MSKVKIERMKKIVDPEAGTIIWLVRWVLVTMFLPGLQACASVDDWIRTKVYKPQVMERTQWNIALAQHPDVSSESLPVSEGQAMEVLKINPGGPDRVAVLYLHGTHRHSLGNLPKLKPLANAGFAIYAPDYRGWGVSTAHLPDEVSIRADAWLAWQKLRERHSRWVIVGHSMGGPVAAGVTAQAAGSPQLCALVLESTFVSFKDVADHSLGVWGRWVYGMGRQRMDARASLDQITVPVYVWHGSLDRTIDPELGHQLYEAARQPKFWETWPLEHNNLQDDPTGRYAQRWRDLAERCR